MPRAMEVAVFLKSLTLSNILSLGPEPHTVELGPLNVIIGPNGSGKSNYIAAIGLLRAVATDIQEPIRTGGGVAEWLCKGGGGTRLTRLDPEQMEPWLEGGRKRSGFEDHTTVPCRS